MYIHIYTYIERERHRDSCVYIYIYNKQTLSGEMAGPGSQAAPARTSRSEKGEVLLRGVGTLR